MACRLRGEGLDELLLGGLVGDRHHPHLRPSRAIAERCPLWPYDRASRHELSRGCAGILEEGPLAVEERRPSKGAWVEVVVHRADVPSRSEYDDAVSTARRVGVYVCT
jgi:hypothetical protein